MARIRSARPRASTSRTSPISASWRSRGYFSEPGSRGRGPGRNPDPASRRSSAMFRLRTDWISGSRNASGAFSISAGWAR